MTPDREKVIKGLEVCRDMDNPPGYRFTSCDPDCPYHGNGCARKLKEDVLALLKEQEAVAIKRQKSMDLVCMVVSAQSAVTGFNQHIHSVDSADRR